MMATKTRKRTQYNLPASEFVSLWGQVSREGGTVADFCKRAGMPADIVYARASEYRRAGVPLPKLRRVNAAGSAPAVVNRLAGLLGAPESGNVIERLLSLVRNMPA
jgi:hypothetical protein